MKLFIKQKIFSFKDKFNIFEERGEIKYTATGEIFTLGKKLHVTDTADNEVIFIRQRLLTLLPKYEISLGTGESVEIVKKITFFKHEYAIPVWDITIKGDFFAHEYEVFRGSEKIAHLSKEWFTFGDAYAIEIPDPRDELTALAAILVVDCCMEVQNNADN